MTRPPYTWDDLRHFLHVAREGSLSAAAGALGVSHATVFRALQRLETDMGVRLFDRSRAGYALTAAGTDLLQVATEVDLAMGAAARRLGSRAAWPGGVVRLTTTDTLMHHLLPPLLSAYQQAAGVQLLVNTSTARHDLLKGEADVAVRAGGRPPDPLVARKLCRIESTVYCSRSLGGVRADQLAQHPWIAGDDSFSHLASSQWLLSQGLDAQTVLRSNSHVNILHLVKAGAGLAVLPCYLADLEPTLRRVIDAPPKAWRSDLWLLTRADLRQVPRIKLLFDMIYDGSRALVPLFEGRLPVG